MRTALLITAKDLRQRLRDRSAYLVAIVAPLALAIALGLTISGVSSVSSHFEVGLADLDRGQAARSLEASVKAPSGPLRVREVKTPATGRRLVKDGRLDSLIVLPRGLSLAAVGGAPVRIDVYGSRDNQFGELVGQSIANSFASYLRTIRVAAGALDASPAKTARIAARVSSSQAPISVNDTTTTKQNLNPKTYFAAAMAVFFLFFAVQFGISSLLNERADGTLARMLAAPIPRRSILGGKALTSIVLGLTSMTVLAVTTRYLLGAHWGNPLGVAALILSAVLAATAVTALVTTLAKTAEQANAWLSMVSVVLGMLGGSFFPVAQAGGLLAALSMATPHAWFLSGLQDLSSGGALSVVLEPMLILLGMTAVCGALALVRIGRLIEP